MVKPAVKAGATAIIGTLNTDGTYRTMTFVNGNDGSYTITYNTSNTLSITSSTVYLKGSFNNWKETDPFEKTDNDDIVTLTKELSAGTYEFKIYYSGTEEYYGNSDSFSNIAERWEMTSGASNCKLKASGGKYEFKYELSTKKLSVYYVAENHFPEFALSNQTSISATKIKLGDALTLTASATGGTAPYQYAFLYKNSTASSYTTAKAYSTVSTASIKLTSVGTYTVLCRVKDSTGTVANKTFTVTVTKEEPEALVNHTVISADSIIFGESVRVTCSSTGGVGTKQYAVWYKKDTQSAWTLVQDYSDNTAVSVKPKNTGTYYISVKVRDGEGTIQKKQLTISVLDTLTNTSTVSANKITKGESVKVTCLSDGGVGTKQYAVWYKKDTQSAWTQAQVYSTNKTVNVKPNYTGTYVISVKVKDGEGTVHKKQFTITVNSTLTNTTKVSTTEITKGESVTVTCSSTGGVDTKQYAVWYKKDTQSAWTQAQVYSTNTTLNVKPNYTGTYVISVKVKDGEGTVNKKQFTITVNSALTNTTKVSTTEITKGNSVKVTCSSTGGAGTKQYAVWYKKDTQSAWTQAQVYSTNKTVNVKPNYTGTYIISVKVKDGEGTVHKKQFTITVNSALTNTTKVSTTEITKGNSVKVTCSSTGGVGTKQYAVWYKKDTQSAWTQAQVYSINKTVNVKPKYTGTYVISVKAQDGDGTIKKKQFTITVK